MLSVYKGTVMGAFIDPAGKVGSVTIQNYDGSVSKYIHNVPKVSVGQSVAPGDAIGITHPYGGGPHLHYIWRPSGGAPANPTRILLPLAPVQPEVVTP